ncbi:acetyltransferase [Vibrio breoganii]|uniref:Acetyltransferase n=1 Tax=Vibrio breoganii TaxID=553239 RepID=A0AAN0XUA3_9VIBR|nr:GNAT family N-acetyltransferase [Vibrio breoganii]ANO32802.1 acetyltransferase [Vibrio breoganii]PMO31421.1 GNAT family N-acetyltransferase [Vibrio breoganii]
MIEIERLNSSYVPSVKDIQLSDESVRFASTADDFLLDGSDTTHLHVIKHHGLVVGFFKLDTAYASTYSFCSKNSIGLRTLALDQRQQGKGLGTKSVEALGDYLANHYQSYDFVYLTVNCKNPAAVACYRKGGFEDTGELYLGGEAGPQHVMRRKITG